MKYTGELGRVWTQNVTINEIPQIVLHCVIMILLEHRILLDIGNIITYEY